MQDVRIAKINNPDGWVVMIPEWVGREHVLKVFRTSSLEDAISEAEIDHAGHSWSSVHKVEFDYDFDTMNVEQARRLLEIYTPGETPEQTMDRIGKNLWAYIRGE